LSVQSATQTLTRTIHVAEGVYAPGHLGELTRVIPFELVDAVLAETGRVQRRLRQLPSRVGVYLVLAMGVFTQVGLGTVWRKLVAALDGIALPTPSEKALRDLRARVGPAPLKGLFEVVAGPLAQPHTPGVSYRRWRTVAFDGCASLRVPDRVGLTGWLDKIRTGWGMPGYPTIMLMCLVETGTRGLLGAAFGPRRAGERAYARKLLDLLSPDMLVLCDRGFDGDKLLNAMAGTGAQVLARVRNTRRPPVDIPLPDGSYLARVEGRLWRVIQADIRLTGHDGTQLGDTYTLLCTLTDHRRDPATELVKLYHERWEIESAYYALRHTICHGRVLRSTTRTGIEQELWALLCVYQALRILMVEATETVPGSDPDRASFSTALHTAQTTITNAEHITDHTHQPGPIGRAVLAHQLPPRRARYSTRKVKSPISRYHTSKHIPPINTTITNVDITIHQPATPPATPPTTGNPLPAVLHLLRSTPGQPWHARDIAHALSRCLTSLNSFRVQLSQWAHKGLIHKTGPATYTTPPP
jgi:hypothetical protein